ncbi:MAG: hypothetical protein K2Q34_02315 [Alphaproteobacteria bacterium]|nr:hypothetical protein [Alphaproteobacteria bacterium]
MPVAGGGNLEINRNFRVDIDGMHANDGALALSSEEPARNRAMAKISIIYENGGALAEKTDWIRFVDGAAAYDTYRIAVFRSGAVHGSEVGFKPDNSPILDQAGLNYRILGMDDIVDERSTFRETFYRLFNRRLPVLEGHRFMDWHRQEICLKAPLTEAQKADLPAHPPAFEVAGANTIVDFAEGDIVKDLSSQAYYHSEQWLMLYLTLRFQNILQGIIGQINAELGGGGLVANNIKFIVITLYSTRDPCRNCSDTLSLFSYAFVQQINNVDDLLTNQVLTNVRERRTRLLIVSSGGIEWENSRDRRGFDDRQADGVNVRIGDDGKRFSPYRPQFLVGAALHRAGDLVSLPDILH